ncbi:MAG: Na+/H+ antiporter NhaA [Epsilonproteobacteria bacterium]|nr:MAG: Na+/H+ antiporter NhaA [Campylobacterota bacterium]
MKRDNKISRYQVFNNETAGGVLLIIAAVMAMIVANSPLSPYYNMLIDIPVRISVGDFEIAKPLLLWINDGLMALFFLAVGLELKREIIEGELSHPKKIILPLLGAIGGMAVPALIYIAFNHDDPIAMNGWAIPTATDIAFALGILMLLGKRVPVALKLFLASLAIFDDIGAIIIIALFYTSELSLTALTVSSVMILLLYIMNKRGATELTTYGILGLILWVSVLKSGVHATLAGVILAFFIPLKVKCKSDSVVRSPLRQLEKDLDKSVTFLILPLFAFTNASVLLSDVTLDSLLHPIPLGIALGLFLGKQLGIFTFCYMGVKLGIAHLPKDINWKLLYGISLLAGVGFTMSLFIASLSFEKTGVNLLFDERLGILVGSILSGVSGYLVLRSALKKNHTADK